MFTLPVCWIMNGYYREKLHVNHLEVELKRLNPESDQRLISPTSNTVESFIKITRIKD